MRFVIRQSIVSYLASCGLFALEPSEITPGYLNFRNPEQFTLYWSINPIKFCTFSPKLCFKTVLLLSFLLFFFSTVRLQAWDIFNEVFAAISIHGNPGKCCSFPLIELLYGISKTPPWASRPVPEIMNRFQWWRERQNKPSDQPFKNIRI